MRERAKINAKSMNRLLSLSIFTGILIGCQTTGKLDTGSKKIEFNQSLADELKAMAVIDQVAAYIRQGEYKQWSQARWDKFKDSVFTTHKVRLEKIFNEFGYPGYSLVGEEGSNNFWLMVQHSDKDIMFTCVIFFEILISYNEASQNPFCPAQNNYNHVTLATLLFCHRPRNKQRLAATNPPTLY
jgi:hypothetical protein